MLFLKLSSHLFRWAFAERKKTNRWFNPSIKQPGKSFVSLKEKFKEAEKETLFGFCREQLSSFVTTTTTTATTTTAATTTIAWPKSGNERPGGKNFPLGSSVFCSFLLPSLANVTIKGKNCLKRRFVRPRRCRRRRRRRRRTIANRCTTMRRRNFVCWNGGTS